MNSLSLVRATIDRSPELAKVFKLSFRHTFPNFKEIHSVEEDLKFFAEVIFKKDQIFIAEENQKILGFIAFNSEFIDQLYVLPEAQRRGIGSRLLKFAQDFSPHLKLWTFQENQRAQAFYKKHGFNEVRRTDGSANEEKEPDILMEWHSKC
jgi:putative acetyltransferase